MLYNTGTMNLSWRIAAAVLIGGAFAACASAPQIPLVDPFPLHFPLTEAWTLEIEGTIAGQPWAKDGIVYCRTGDGSVTAVVASSRAVLSRSGVDSSLPDLSGQTGELVFERDAGSLRAVDKRGRIVWTFKGDGAIAADPVAAERRVYFGDTGRVFYCLDAATGKVKWRRRLQGAPVQPAVIGGGAIAVAASNSVVYRLARRSGSILSWEAIPSRVIYELAAAGPLVLISSASPTFTALDLRTGKRAGQYEAPGLLVAGAVWSAPYIVLFIEDEESGRQKIVFLRSR